MSRFNGFSRVDSKFRIGFWALLLVSCTIIEDSDITSPNDYSKLKLKGFEIKQSTNKGEQTSTAQITINASGKIEKINWPALGDFKFKFRTPISTSATSLLTYNSAGTLTTFDTQVGSQSVEKYDFLYNSAGQLIRLISSGTFANNIVSTSDSLIYNTEGRLIKFERTFNFTIGPKTKQTINNFTYPNGTLSAFTYNNINEYMLVVGTGYCPNNKSSTACTRYQYTEPGTNKTPYVRITHNQTGTIVNRTEFDNTGGCDGCSLGGDAYNFHPLMLVSSVIIQGNDLLSVYMIDWWIPGNETIGISSKNESVSFNFLYGQ